MLLLVGSWVPRRASYRRGPDSPHAALADNSRLAGVGARYPALHYTFDVFAQAIDAMLRELGL